MRRRVVMGMGNDKQVQEQAIIEILQGFRERFMPSRILDNGRVVYSARFDGCEISKELLGNDSGPYVMKRYQTTDGANNLVLGENGHGGFRVKLEDDRGGRKMFFHATIVPQRDGSDKLILERDSACDVYKSKSGNSVSSQFGFCTSVSRTKVLRALEKFVSEGVFEEFLIERGGAAAALPSTVFGEAQKRTDVFSEKLVEGVKNDLKKTFTECDSREAVTGSLNSSFITVHPMVIKAMQRLVQLKVQNGTDVERRFFGQFLNADQTLNVDRYVKRLIECRPIKFYLSSDECQMRPGSSVTSDDYKQFLCATTLQKNSPGYERVLSDYISYEEMELSALVSVGSRTKFHTNGTWGNTFRSPGNSKVDGGYITGLVGPRLEDIYLDYSPDRRENAFDLGIPLMDKAVIFVQQNINTRERGYGVGNRVNQRLEVLKTLYDVGHFPTFEEAQQDTSGRFVPSDRTDRLVDTVVLKKRLKAVLEPKILKDDEIAGLLGKKGISVIPGISTGAWANGVGDVVSRAICDVVAEICDANVLSNIQRFHFPLPLESVMSTRVLEQRFPGSAVYQHGTDGNGSNVVRNLQGGKSLEISRRPTQSLATAEASQLVILNGYAWDGNSYPGNEYYEGTHCFRASADPVAVCGSDIAITGNIVINPHLSQVKVQELGKENFSVAMQHGGAAVQVPGGLDVARQAVVQGGGRRDHMVPAAARRVDHTVSYNLSRRRPSKSSVADERTMYLDFASEGDRIRFVNSLTSNVRGMCLESGCAAEDVKKLEYRIYDMFMGVDSSLPDGSTLYSIEIPRSFKPGSGPAFGVYVNDVRQFVLSFGENDVLSQLLRDAFVKTSGIEVRPDSVDRQGCVTDVSDCEVQYQMVGQGDVVVRNRMVFGSQFLASSSSIQGPTSHTLVANVDGDLRARGVVAWDGGKTSLEGGRQW